MFVVFKIDFAVMSFNRYMVECEFKSRGTVVSMEP